MLGVSSQTEQKVAYEVLESQCMVHAPDAGQVSRLS